MDSQLPLQRLFKGKKIILASTSPRRRELLGLFGFEFSAVAPTFDEKAIKPESFWSIEEYVTELAKGKLKSALELDECKGADVVISSDTVVHLDGNILGKPGTHEKAYEYLKMLSGKNHNVLTGVAIAMRRADYNGDEDKGTAKYDGESKNANDTKSIPKDESGYSILTFAEPTIVKMIDAPDDLLRAYANTNEPLDKAGAYAIQGIGGAHFIIGIDGDYSNVVGLPLCRLGITLREAASTIWNEEE